MSSNQPPTVLVADDHEANRLLVQDTLESEGFRVVCGEDGEQALELFERERPDVSVLDVRMPKLDGIATCQRMRQMPGGRETPILFLTALRDIDTFEQALQAGADDYLTKPVRPTELVVRVRTALRVRKLSTELQTQYEELRRQRDNLLRLSLQKERLLAFIVHDLKNPVNSIDLQAQVLLASDDLSAEAQASATHIRAETLVLARMISNLLDISKADEGKLLAQPVRVDLDALVGTVLRELSPHAARHEVSFEIDLACHEAWTDRELLRRVLGNLCDNAIRHAPPGSKVQVRARRDAETHGVVIEVRDFGDGVPMAERELIFEAFSRGETGQVRTRGGRGLGLAFCKLAASVLDGSIHVEEADPGALFRLCLPAPPT